MNRKQTHVPQDVLKAGIDTYRLEKSLMESNELNEELLEKALEAALLQYKRRVEDDIAKAARVYAEEFQDGEETEIEGATLLWFAEKIENDLGPAYMNKKRYQPQDDDVVEVSIVGTVTVFSDTCPHCHEDLDNPSFSVRDDMTGEEYHYLLEDITHGLRVRVLHYADDPTS